MSGIRRNIKNVAHNYTDAQVKVREATSNDPWGPSSTMMSEIADLTYHVVAFSEIMQMLWKRLNDSGKNWRHVYKALVLLEYLIKTGNEKVAQQCKENIFAIQTLKDFQFIDDNKDQGLNVREKAKALVSLLKDDEKLKNERVRALKAKERFAQSTAGIGSDTVYSSTSDPMSGGVGGGSPLGSPADDVLKPDLEIARPQTQGEEELQLQLALAMSREEADAEETKKKSDDMRLTLAIQKSKEEKDKTSPAPSKPTTSALVDLADLNFGPSRPPPAPLGPPPGQPCQPSPPARTAASMDPWSPVTQEVPSTDPWGAPANDPWSAPTVASQTRASPSLAAFETSPSRGLAAVDPWSPVSGSQLTEPSNGPWGAAAAAPPMASSVSPHNWSSSPTPVLQPRLSPQPPKLATDPFSPTTELQTSLGDASNNNINISGVANNGQVSSNPWDMAGLEPAISQDLLGVDLGQRTGAKPKKSVGNILSEHSNLVNLDNLIQGGTAPVAKNPFADQPNPFQAAAAPKPSMNQLRTGGQVEGGTAWPSGTTQSSSPEFNPFF